LAVRLDHFTGVTGSIQDLPERPLFSWQRPTAVSGGDSEEATPVPIPNTVVKLLSADGTARAIAWESRSPPDFPSSQEGLAFLALLLSSSTDADEFP
jgi:hypothetical protein